jgi:hypothetical protein
VKKYTIMTEKVIRYSEESEEPIPGFIDFDEKLTVDIEIINVYTSTSNSVSQKMSIKELREMNSKELDDCLCNLGKIKSKSHCILVSIEELIPFKCNKMYLLNEKIWNFMNKFLMEDIHLNFTLVVFPEYCCKKLKTSTNNRIEFGVYENGKYVFKFNTGKTLTNTIKHTSSPFIIVITATYKKIPETFKHKISFKANLMGKYSIDLKEEIIQVFSNTNQNIKKYPTDIIFKEALKRKTGVVDLGDLLFDSTMGYPCSVISGSFVMQTLLGEKWDNSDIDIYTLTPTTAKLRLKPYLIEPWKSKSPKKNCYDSVNGIVEVFESTFKNGCIVQIIHCDCIWKALDSFDSEVCMNAYDGKNLYIKDKENLFAKKMIMKKSSPEREKKYASRGFQIIKN